MKDVAGKVAFITGGASGMGLGMAKVFAENGMKIVMADIRQEALDEAMGYFRKTNLPVHPLKLDVTDREAYARAADEAESVFGKVHVLVNNAGVGVAGPMQAATFRDWDFNMSVNVGGVINGLVIMLPRMLAHGEEGHIVTTSSTGGFSAVGNAGLYCTAKFAVAGMMESLATDLKGTKIGASVFFPGPVRTNLGVSTQSTRPDHLKNAGESPMAPPPPKPGEKAPPMRPGVDLSLFMDPDEVGLRVLSGIKRGDLFIMTHPEFKDGIVARNNALIRAIPDEPLNEPRHQMLKVFGSLLYNPIYDEQTTPKGIPPQN